MSPTRRSGLRPGPRCAGFSLTEVLLALALAAVVMLAATRLLAGSRGAEATVSSTSGSMLALDLAADLLADDLRRSCYVPVPTPVGVALDRRVPCLVLAITDSDQGDVLGVRYVDDRLADGPVLRDLRFEAGVDGRGEPQLYRRTATGHRQPLVQGIAGVRVTGWVDATGMHARGSLVAGTFEPWLVLLELTKADGARRTAAVPLPSRPTAEVVRAP